MHAYILYYIIRSTSLVSTLYIYNSPGPKWDQYLFTLLIKGAKLFAKDNEFCWGCASFTTCLLSGKISHPQLLGMVEKTECAASLLKGFSLRRKKMNNLFRPSGLMKTTLNNDLLPALFKVVSNIVVQPEFARSQV